VGAIGKPVGALFLPGGIRIPSGVCSLFVLCPGRMAREGPKSGADQSAIATVTGRDGEAAYLWYVSAYSGLPGTMNLTSCFTALPVVGSASIVDTVTGLSGNNPKWAPRFCRSSCGRPIEIVVAKATKTGKLPKNHPSVRNLLSSDTESTFGDMIMPAGMGEADDFVFLSAGPARGTPPIFLTMYLTPNDGDCLMCCELAGFRVTDGLAQVLFATANRFTRNHVLDRQPQRPGG
jgi:hypothetical protein